jgi:hypothetical protein
VAADTPPLRIVNAELRFPRVDLIEPSASRFIQIAAEVESRPPFLPDSGAKKQLLAKAKDACTRLAREPGVKDYTAGWFEVETDLHNSTVLLPDDAATSQYSIINHCRWDRLRDVLPAMLLKKTFHSYVLDNFAANNVAAMPILYRLA